MVMSTSCLIVLVSIYAHAALGYESDFSPSVWFDEHPQFSVALPGDSVFFSCKTNSAAADGSIRWLYNHSIVVLTTDGTIKIPEPGQLNVRVDLDAEQYSKQMGQYQCIAATDGPGKYVASLPAKLTIAKLDDFPPERAKTIEAFRSNDVVIACNSPHSNPPAFIQFYKDGVVVTDGGNSEVLNGETLLIYNVSDANTGNYTCSASNHITNEKKMARTWSLLKVKEPSKNEKSRLTFRPEERYSVLLGENLTIPCVASGHPKPDIIWTRMGNNERLNSHHGCLTITNAQEIDLGSYMCAIFNGSRRFLRRTTIHVLVPPVFTKVPKKGSPVQEGDPLWLHCQAMGTPFPEVEWSVNGLPVKQDGAMEVMANGTLHLSSVRKRDEGVYQCFVSNSVGQNFTTMALRVNATGEFPDDSLNSDASDWYQPSILDHLSLTPPSKPNVTQASSRSVLLTWNVPRQHVADGGMPIQFFKVQFREFRRGHHRSEWRTLDEVISARSRSFEVMGLKPDLKYRFRLVAVYANDDNLHGPLSKRFKLDKAFNLDRPPKQAPTITEVLPLSGTSLRVGWRMNKISLGSVEGYFIYIRRSGSRTKFRKITLIGHESHSYIFEELDPGTLYELRVEAFNLAGNSPSSRLSKKATLVASKEEETSISPSSLPNTGSAAAAADNNTVAVVKGDDMSKDDLVPTGDLVFILILGGALVGLVLVLVICCSVFSCVQKSRARKRFTNANVAIHEKYTDTSRQISMHHSHNNGHAMASSSQLYHSQVSPSSGGGPIIGSSSASTSAHTVTLASSEANNLDSEDVETSFTSPNRLSQMLGSIGERSQPDLFVSSRTNPRASILEENDPSLGRSDSDLEGIRVCHYPAPSDADLDEYTDEPSVLSWKRRRRSEEVL